MPSRHSKRSKKSKNSIRGGKRSKKSANNKGKSTRRSKKVKDTADDKKDEKTRPRDAQIVFVNRRKKTKRSRSEYPSANMNMSFSELQKLAKNKGIPIAGLTKQKLINKINNY